MIRKQCQIHVDAIHIKAVFFILMKRKGLKKTQPPGDFKTRHLCFIRVPP